MMEAILAKLSAKVEKWFKIPGDEDGAELKILHLKPGSMVAVAFDLKDWNSIFSATSTIVIKSFQ